MNKRLLVYMGMVCLALLAMASIGPGQAAAEPGEIPVEIGGTPPFIVLVADPQVNQFHVPAPTGSLEARAENITATINIVYLQNQEDKFGYWCEPWPSQAKAAFDAAANIWGTTLHSMVPIKVHACWTDLDSGILGGSATDSYIQNFPSAPVSDIWYSVSLANALSGSDQNGGDPEMHHVYNKNFDWYYGTDGNTPANQYDFLTTVLHEMGHGLGFEGSMIVDDQGYGSWGWDYYSDPAIFDRFTENGSGQALLGFGNGTIALGDQLTSNNVYFDGLKANAANGSQRVKLYAPLNWVDGSSYSHLDDKDFNNTINALMTYSLSNGESVHDPGPVTKGLLQDLGWQEYNTAPSISGMPDQHVPMNIGGSSLIDLWAFASDDQTPSGELTYSIDNSPAAGAGVSIAGNRYIDVDPASGWTGVTEVRVKASDPGGLFDTDTFELKVSLSWDGSTNTNWQDASNWSSGVVPDAAHLVTIPVTTNQPVLNGDAEAGSLEIDEGASLDLGIYSLTVEESLQNNGILRQTASVSGGTTTEYLRIRDQAGVDTVYYGLAITPDSGSQAGGPVTVSISGNQLCSRLVPGVLRCFEITTQASMTAAVRFYFSDNELNKRTLNQLLAFRLDGEEWLEEPGPYHRVDAGGFNYVEVENLDEFSQFGLSEFLMGKSSFLPNVLRDPD
jgi:hypothetical protein